MLSQQIDSEGMQLETWECEREEGEAAVIRHFYTIAEPESDFFYMEHSTYMWRDARENADEIVASQES